MAKDKTKISKKIKKLEKSQPKTPTIADIQSLQGEFISYMQDSVNLPSRKAFLQEVIEKILVTNEKIEVIFKI